MNPMDDCKATWRENAREQVRQEIASGQLRPEDAAKREAELYAELERIGLDS
jgi:DNA-binding GntR family transcriptional regulator